MKAQEVFDEIVSKIVAQGQPSLGTMASTETCMYRGDGNLKCAVGMIIPDENYTSDIEGMGVEASEVMKAMPEEYVEHVGLLNDLQSCHDFASETGFVADFIRRANGVAKEHELKPYAW